MKPLVFLTLRSTVNGIRRAVTSPRRLFSLLFAVGYYFYFFIFRGFGPRANVSVPHQMVGRIAFPAMETLDAVAFGVFAVLSLVMMLGIFAQRGGFKPADVDILFATPVSPKIVLVFRIVREYLATLILPLFFAVIFFRPAAMGWQALFSGMPNPGSAGLVMRTMGLSWVMMAMCWVAIAYAASLFVNRSDRQSDLNKRFITWGTVAGILALALFIWWRIRGIGDAHGFITLAQSPVLRVTFFTATAATNMTLAPLAGSWTMGLFGAGLMVAVVLVAFRLAMSQVGWLYDQAAVRGFDQHEARALQARGDFFGMAAQRARTGKAKAQKRTWLHRLRLQGPPALLWKEYFLQKRGMTSLLIVFLVPALLMSLMPVMLPSKAGDQIGPSMFLVMQALCVLMITMNMASTGFIEVLRRVDMQKPLPFTPAMIAFMEIGSKAAWAAAANGIAIVAAFVAKPQWWSHLLASALYSPALSLLISATVFLVTMLFPDSDDRSQRQFHRLMSLLAVVIVAAPGFGLGLGLILVGANPILAACAAALVNVGISVGITAIAGGLYASYNPSE